MICSGYVEITLLEGRSWIKDLQVGDLALDEEGKYKKITKIIQEDISKRRIKIFDIYYLDENQEKGLHRISGDTFVVTGETKRKKTSTSIRNLKVGDKILTKNGFREVNSIMEIPNVYTVGYSIEGANLKYYFLDNVLICDTI